MSAKKTLIVAIIFILAVGWYLWDQRRLEQQTQREEQAARVVAPDVDQLVSLTLKTEAGSIHLARTDGNWRITQPIEARADHEKIDQLLASLDELSRKEAFEVSTADLTQFGLAAPSLQIDMRTTEGQQLPALMLGDRTPDASSIYARLGEGNEIFTIPVATESTLKLDLYEARDKRLVPADLDDAHAIQLAFNDADFALQHTETGWRLLEPISEPADEDQINTFADTLGQARIQRFVDDPEPLESYGLADPAWRAVFDVPGATTGTQQTYTLLIGDLVTTGGARRWAKLDAEPIVFEIESSVYGQLQPTLTDLRSKQLIELAAPEIDRVEFRQRRDTLTLERNDEGFWQFADDPEARVDQTRVANKLSQLTRMQAVEFFEPAPPDTETGLAEPNVWIVVYDQDAGTSQSLLTGIKPEDEEYVYARVYPSARTVGVDWREPGNFFVTRDDFLDRSLLVFTPGDVQSVVLSDGSTTATFERQETGAWKAQTPDGRTVTVPAPEMSSLLYSATALDWKRRLKPEFESDLTLIKTHNLEDPERVVLFKGENDEPLGRLGQAGQSEINVFVATTPGDYFVIDKALFATFSEAVQRLFDRFEVESPPQAGAD